MTTFPEAKIITVITLQKLEITVTYFPFIF